ncbi:MAG: hypothetical protein M0Z31_01825 [Clostridia bacterium]|nr:hypothetical protein [Clostridia bacterium]
MENKELANMLRTVIKQERKRENKPINDKLDNIEKQLKYIWDDIKNFEKRVSILEEKVL